MFFDFKLLLSEAYIKGRVYKNVANLCMRGKLELNSGIRID